VGREHGSWGGMGGDQIIDQEEANLNGSSELHDAVVKEPILKDGTSDGVILGSCWKLSSSVYMYLLTSKQIPLR
jgi:hypothetical protein